MPEKAQWTWLVYMAGDNNLESAGRDDLNEMRQIGSTPQVNVLVQFDTERNKTTRYRVEKDRLNTLQELPGVNCGDPKVLSEFIRWGADNYPAEHYVVDVWNHGGGWEDLPPDYDFNSIRSAKPARARKLLRLKRSLFRTTIDRIDAMPGTMRAIAIDCGSHDYLDNQELRTAIAGGLPDGQKADILGCDACLMNMVEIAYEMKDTADFMVGSEETEPAAGWPYAAILQKLVANPGMTPSDLSQTIARSYGEWYQRHGNPSTDGAVTQSALQLDKLMPLVTVIGNLTSAVMKDLKTFADPLLLACLCAQKFEYPEYVDLGDLMAQFIRRVPGGSAMAKQARAVQTALSAFVTENRTWGRGVSNATGVSIYFPSHAKEYSPEYAKLRFNQEVHWDKLLQAVIPGLGAKSATA